MLRGVVFHIPKDKAAREKFPELVSSQATGDFRQRLWKSYRHQFDF